MMMTCFEADANMPRYCAGKLSKGEREGLRSHLAVCSGCAERAAEMGHAVHLIRDSVAQVPDPGPRDVPEPLLRAVITLASVASAPNSSVSPRLKDIF